MQVSLRRGESPTLTYVTIGDVELAFSYETVVAFREPGTGWVVSENIWSVTTGRHLNLVAPGTRRTERDEFVQRLDKRLRSLDAVTA